MADLTITAASVQPGSGAIKETGVAGEALTAGQAVYKSSSTGKWLKADNNSATAEVRAASGIALTGSAADQPVVVQTAGTIAIGASLTAGVAYYLSDTAGAICPVDDLTSGQYVEIIGVATSAGNLLLIFASAGVAL